VSALQLANRHVRTHAVHFRLNDRGFMNIETELLGSELHNVFALSPLDEVHVGVRSKLGSHSSILF
jgi:hypothetical protein